MVPELNASIPHSARIYDYLLGGKDNFAADRDAADAIVRTSPGLPTSMRENRRYMVRAAQTLAAEYGIRQFLDIGTGLPTTPNLHDVVQQVDSSARVVYVDNDPLVLVHARALLTSAPEGVTAYLDADLLEPEQILASPEVTEILDLRRPVALSLIAVLQFVTDEPQAQRIIDTLMAALVPGSAVAVSTVTAHNAQAVRAAEQYTQQGIPAKPRTIDEVHNLLSDLNILEPGVVPVHRWRAEPDDVEDDDVQMIGAVAIKS